MNNPLNNSDEELLKPKMDEEPLNKPSHSPSNYESSGHNANAVNATTSFSHFEGHDPNACFQWSPFSVTTGVVVPYIVFNPDPPAPEKTCSFCQKTQTDPKDPIFSPCKCKSAHRSCMRKWRISWISPKNYWSCPDCLYNYRYETIGELNTDTKKQITRNVRIQIAKVWIVLLTIILGSVSLLALISWATDKSNKNIPVFIKSVMTSVVFGFPNSNSTKLWREQFKQPDVHVFQYYGLFGSFLVSLIICVLACCADTDDQKKSGRGCGDQCYCSGYGDESDSCFWCCYWSSSPYGGTSSACDCTACCNSCGSCECDCMSSGGSCGDCSVGDCKGGGEAAAILVVVVVVVVLVSAIFVAIGYAVRKSAQLHDSIATAIESQSRELEANTVLLGMDEFVRAKDKV